MSQAYTRKATFKVVKTKTGEREFLAVNKRAHHVCKRAGKRSRLSAKALKSMVGKGSYKFYAYTDTGALKAIRF